MFDSIARSTEDVTDRIQNVSTRTKNLINKLPNVETTIRTHDASNSQPNSLILYSNREGYVPNVLTRKSNPSFLKDYYAICALPPPLWKLESVFNNPEDNSYALSYSNPGK